MLGTPHFNEASVELAALSWLERLGYDVHSGPEIAHGSASEERADAGYHDVVLERHLHQALARLNPELPPEALDQAFRRLSNYLRPA
jgi:type I restriction enzyme, R subunit